MNRTRTAELFDSLLRDKEDDIIAYTDGSRSEEHNTTTCEVVIPSFNINLAWTLHNLPSDKNLQEKMHPDEDIPQINPMTSPPYPENCYQPTPTTLWPQLPQRLQPQNRRWSRSKLSVRMRGHRKPASHSNRLPEKRTLSHANTPIHNN